MVMRSWSSASLLGEGTDHRDVSLAMRGRAWCVLGVLAALLAPPALWADWVNLSGAETAPNIAEITVVEEGVRVAFELYPADETAFFDDGRFLLDVQVGGASLEPEILLREPRTRKDRVSPFAGMVDPRTRRQLPGTPEDKRVIFLDVVYRFDAAAALPGSLTLAPPTDEAGVVVATIGFLLTHKSVPVVDFRYLSQPETLALDWDDPWYTAFGNLNLVRHHRWPQMTFLYMAPREVRHESLVRVRDLMVWTEKAPDVQRRLDEADQARVVSAAASFFLAKNPVTIDGETVQRSSFRAEFLEITPRGLQVVAPDTSLDASVALLGVSEAYWVEGLPNTVNMEWELFDERISQVPTNVTDPAGPYPSFIDPDMPTLVWENFLRGWTNPVLNPVSAEAEGWFDTLGLRMALLGDPGEEEAARIVDALIRQITIAYLERDPAARIEALSQVVDPANLDDLMLELDRVFALPTTGGGVASLEAYSEPVIEELTEAPGDIGFRALARWRAGVAGKHWGHVDQRIIHFRALMDIGIVDGLWKLRGLTVLEASDAAR